MRILFYIVLPAIFISGIHAQNPRIDSLLGLSGVLSGSELGKVYAELSQDLMEVQTDSALYFANQAELLLGRSDPENLLPYVYKTKGGIYGRKMVYDRSLSYYNRAYEEFIKLGILEEIGACAQHIGHIHYELADYSDAYSFYLHSLDAFEKLGDRMGIAKMQNNLGTVSHEMGNLDDAEKHYQNAYRIYRTYHSVPDECRALNNIGLILYDKQVYDSALYYFREVLEKLDPDSLHTDDELHVLSGVYNNLALVYTDLDEHRMALQYLYQGLDIAWKLGDQFYVGSVFTNLGSIFGNLQQQDSALYYLHRALRIAKQMGFKHLELEVYDELARLHADMGSYASAYNWLLRYDTVYKAVFNEQQAEKTAQLRARYEQEISEREIEQLQAESQVQRMLNKVFIIFFVVIVVLVIIITINLRSRKIANQQLAEQNLQISNAIEKLSESEKELQVLNKSKDRIFSVVAHDLRNPVAAVTGFSELLYDNFEQFPVETQKEYLLQITQGTLRIQNLLENLLIWARSQMKAVKYNPADLKLRSVVDECVRELKANLDHKKIACSVKIERKCLVFADKAMIHTVFRNLIMNAVKFSFPGGKIYITSRNEAGMCYVSVEDEGIGIQPEIQNKLFDANEVVSTPGTTGESGSGLGLVICREFLERNKGSIRVESEPGNGATFIMGIPLSAST